MRTAVVVGGSVAGLAAARVLADHAENVVIIEADDLASAGPDGRPGAPQGVQLHALLDMGRTQFERWFPGLTDELVADGAVLSEGGRLLQFVDGELKVPVPGYRLISATRPFLEARLRRRVLARGNVTLLRGRADGLDIGGRRVRGVRYRPVGAGGEGRECLPADFVVDATGRASRIGAWLEKEGRQPPPLERMPIDLGYATALFRRGEELPGVFVAHALAGPAGVGGSQPDAGAMAEVEGGRWMVVLAAYADRRPTTDPEEFLARCAALVTNDRLAPFREVVRHCELLGDVAVHRIPDSRRRDFGRLEGFPAGLVAVGDAVAAFNPVYGQGMASAALHASCLSAYLRSGASRDEPAWGYFTRARVVVDAAWQLSTLGDLALPHVPGPYPPGYRAARWYGDSLARASIHDREVNRRFLDVVNMREHPRLLTRPGTVLRVARALRAQRNA